MPCLAEQCVFDRMGTRHDLAADPTGIFRGGFYLDTVRNEEGFVYPTAVHNYLRSDYSTGVRCCTDMTLPTESLSLARRSEVP